MKLDEMLQKVPDMVINLGMKVKGDLKFDGLLRLEGEIEGQLVAPLDAQVMLLTICFPFIFVVSHSRL